MNHTAIDLTPAWYENGIGKEVTTDELNKRKVAIAEFNKSSEISVWVNCLKVYLGKVKSGTADFDAIIDIVRTGDDNFNIQNENLIKVICGCAIGQKMDEKSELSDLLALALITTTVVSNAASVIPDLRARASYIWTKSCEDLRSVDTDFNFGNGNLKSASKSEIPELVDQSTFKTYSEATTKAFTTIQKELTTANAEINIIHSALEVIKTNFISLSEETNVLWWLFGAYSDKLKKPFRAISPELLSIVIPLELSDLTQLLPGIGGVKSIISRAFMNAEFEFGSTHSLTTIIESIASNEEILKEHLPESHRELNIFTPFLSAIKCRSEYAGNEWKAIYSKQVEIDLESKFTYDFFALQLYQELMLLNVYQNGNE